MTQEGPDSSVNIVTGMTSRVLFATRVRYSAYNHKRATAVKCRESHHRRTDATTAVPFPDRESAVVSAVV
jgi:hypothetical protein